MLNADRWALCLMKNLELGSKPFELYYMFSILTISSCHEPIQKIPKNYYYSVEG